MQFSSEDFNVLYRAVVEDVLTYGASVSATKGEMKEVMGSQITLLNVKKNRIDFSSTMAFKRQANYEAYLSKELSWYSSGDLSAASAPAPMWRKLSDRAGNIQSNYGYIVLFQKHEYERGWMTPYEHIVSILKEKKTSRQAIAHYNLPEHYKNNPADIPCTVAAQFYIREDRLNLLVFQRSSDLFYGLPYDLPWHCHLMEKLVSDLSSVHPELSLGNLTMQFGSVHIYKEKIEFFRKFLEPGGMVA